MRNKDQNQFNWQPGNVSTFSQQAQNLGQQVGDQGLNTSQIDIQRQTAEAERKAGQSGQNVAAGAAEAAKGAVIDPTMAQAPVSNNPSDISQPKVQPYVEKSGPIDEPDTNITSQDIRKNANYDPKIDDYISKLFPDGVPDSFQSKLDEYFNRQAPGTIHNENWINPYSSRKEGTANQSDRDKYNEYVRLHPDANQDTSTRDFNAPLDFSGDDLKNNFQEYLTAAQKPYKDFADNPQDVEQYKNYLHNQLADQLQKLNVDYQRQQGSIAEQNTAKQKLISDYIDKLQTGLKNYQTSAGDLSNVGQLSDIEKSASEKNALLAGDNVSGTTALGALSRGGIGNTRLAALSQQAQNAAIQDAEGKARAAQQEEKTGSEVLEAGQKAQAKAFKDAAGNITENQNNQLKKLDQSNTDAQKALKDAYNYSGTKLNEQEQDYINRAQDTLKNAKVPEATIKNATNAFANSVNSYIDKGQLDANQKQQLGKQLESIWRVAVGSNPSDIHFSDEIANILIPLYQKLDYKPVG